MGNAVHELSRQLVCPTKTHYDAMLTTMPYVKSKANQGLVFNPFG